jgi:ATP-binding cassette subfamily F protein 3
MRRKVAEIEKTHEKLQWDLKAVEDALNDPALYNGAGNTEKVADLTKQQADLTRAIKDAEYEWMKALDAYEKAEAAGE